MQNTVAQEEFTQGTFSSDPTVDKEQPGSPYYANGVDVGYTAPAKWWNWFWNKLTLFMNSSRSDRLNMLTEMKSVLTAASVVPDAAKDNQLLGAVKDVCTNRCGIYDNEEVTEEIDGVMVTHKANQPYVVGYKLYIPDTELL